MTQSQLGKRLGIQGQTVHRWETNQAAPTPRHEREMVKVIATYSAEAAAALQAALDGAPRKVNPAEAPPAAPQPAPVPLEVRPSDALQLAVFGLADDLDVPPRRLRRSLARFLESLRAAHLTAEAAELQLNTWIAEQRY